MSDDMYVEPLCKCGQRFIEHSEPCKYWRVDIHTYRRQMWRCIIWQMPKSRNRGNHDEFHKAQIMPVLLPSGAHKFDIRYIEIICLSRAFCEDMGINYREIE